MGCHDAIGMNINYSIHLQWMKMDEKSCHLLNQIKKEHSNIERFIIITYNLVI